MGLNFVRLNNLKFFETRKCKISIKICKFNSTHFPCNCVALCKKLEINIICINIFSLSPLGFYRPGWPYHSPPPPSVSPLFTPHRYARSSRTLRRDARNYPKLIKKRTIESRAETHLLHFVIGDFHSTKASCTVITRNTSTEFHENPATI